MRTHDVAMSEIQLMYHSTQHKCWKCKAQIKHYRGRRRIKLAHTHYLFIKKSGYRICTGSNKPRREAV
jgi:hypothetical protein